jgi:hypothetical protein
MDPKIEARKCLRCGHKWYPESPRLPVRCPNPACRSPYWDIPRKSEVAK